MAGRLVIDFYDTVMFQLMKCLLLMLPLRKSFLRISYLTDGIIHLLLSAFVFVVLQFAPLFPILIQVLSCLPLWISFDIFCSNRKTEFLYRDIYRSQVKQCSVHTATWTQKVTFWWLGDSGEVLKMFHIYLKNNL